MSLEALLANLKPYDTRVHELRGFSGAIRSAKAIMRCIEGSDLQTGAIKTKVQDVSMRSSPQVIGAAHDAVAWAKKQVDTELSGVGDNPIFIPEARLTLTGANFQGTPVSLPMDLVGAAVTMVSSSPTEAEPADNPALRSASRLPDEGAFSGLMLSHTPRHLIVGRGSPAPPRRCRSPPPRTKRTSSRWG
jgi:histidine ammonia-lyase